MPRVTFTPSPPETLQTKSFRTHSHYLKAFAILAGFDTFATPDRVLAELAREHALGVAEPLAPADDDAVRDCLHRAWATELLLLMTVEHAREDVVVRLAASWAAVQCYYAAYGITQALIVARGSPRPRSHDLTQQQFVDLWVNIGVQPWSFTFDGTTYSNTPGRAIDTSVHAWSHVSVDTAWDIAAAALRSTRKAMVQEAETAARTQKSEKRARESGPVATTKSQARVRLNALERDKVRARVRAVSMLDYLFRLRIKANYEDARMFTEGPEADHEAWAVSRDFVNLTSATMLAHELRIGAILGRKKLAAIAHKWANSNYPAGTDGGLRTRLTLM